MLIRPSHAAKARKAATSKRHSGQNLPEYLLAVARQGDAAGLALSLQVFFFDTIDSLATITASLCDRQGRLVSTEPDCPVAAAFIDQLASASGEGLPRTGLGEGLWSSQTPVSPVGRVAGAWQVAFRLDDATAILLTWQDGDTSGEHRHKAAIRQMVEAVQLRLSDLGKLHRLGRLAFVDPLTGLGNSRQLKRFVADQINRANRFGGGFTLLFIDLDKFKAINDTHGHDEGDRVLIRTARGLESAVRSVDKVFRLAGDEFVIVLAGAGAGTSAAVISRIRGALAKEPHQPTCSVGIASYPTDGYTYNELLKAADQGMYRHKNGRGAAE